MKYIALISLCLVACGSSTAPTTTSGDNPNCPADVTRPDPNSWILAEPEIHLDFWGDWNNFPQAKQPSSYEYDWFVLFNYGNVLQRLSEYGVHEGTIDLNYYTNTGSTTYVNDGGTDDAGQYLLDDSSFANTLNLEIEAGSLPYPNDNTLYLVMLPPNVFSNAMLTHHWGGYHTHSTYGTQRYTFAIISYQNDEVVASHEIYEAATNPSGYSFWDRKTSNEIGDVCNPYNETVAGITVQKVWSQTLCQCQ